MRNLALLIIAGLSLSACATNMSTDITSNSSSQVITEYPIETAMINIYAKPYTSTVMQRTLGNIRFFTEVNIVPKGKVKFDGQSVQASEATSTMKANNQVISQYVAINYYTLDPLVFRGFTLEDMEYSIGAQTATIPKSARIGASSTYLTENVYSDSSKSDLIRRYTQRWQLSQANNNTAWLCIVSSTNLLLDSDPEDAFSECHNINSDGDILESRIGDINDEHNGMIIINLHES